MKFWFVDNAFNKTVRLLSDGTLIQQYFYCVKLLGAMYMEITRENPTHFEINLHEIDEKLLEWTRDNAHIIISYAWVIADEYAARYLFVTRDQIGSKSSLKSISGITGDEATTAKLLPLDDRLINNPFKKLEDAEPYLSTALVDFKTLLTDIPLYQEKTALFKSLSSATSPFPYPVTLQEYCIYLINTVDAKLKKTSFYSWSIGGLPPELLKTISKSIILI